MPSFASFCVRLSDFFAVVSAGCFYDLLSCISSFQYFFSKETFKFSWVFMLKNKQTNTHKLKKKRKKRLACSVGPRPRSNHRGGMKTLYCGTVVVGVTGYLLPESRRLQSSQPPASPHLSMSIKNMILTSDSLAYLLFIMVFNNIQGTDRDHLLSTHHYSTCNMDLWGYVYRGTWLAALWQESFTGRRRNLGSAVVCEYTSVNQL